MNDQTHLAPPSSTVALTDRDSLDERAALRDATAAANRMVRQGSLLLVVACLLLGLAAYLCFPGVSRAASRVAETLNTASADSSAQNALRDFHPFAYASDQWPTGLSAQVNEMADQVNIALERITRSTN